MKLRKHAVTIRDFQSYGTDLYQNETEYENQTFFGVKY